MLLNSRIILNFVFFISSIFSLIVLFTVLFLDFFAPYYNDSPEPWAIGFQDGVSPGYTGIIELHDNIFFILVVIAILVFWMLGSTIYFFNFNRTKLTHKYLVHGTLIEILWTIFPAIVLLAIAIPSFRLLYILDEVTLPTITVKVTGFLKDGLKSHLSQKIKDTKDLRITMVKKILWLSIILKNSAADNQQNRTSSQRCRGAINIQTTQGQRLNKLISSIDILRAINIPSTSFIRSYQVRRYHVQCRAIKRIGPHNLDVISTIYGILLGDGYANNRSGEGVRIAIKQSEIHKEYLFFLYSFFLDKGYCSKIEPRKYERRIKGKDKIYFGYEFNTFTFRSFLWIYNSFYKNGKKILPVNLERFLNEQTLAIWIMDDGGWTGSGVRISANSFTLLELDRLINIISNNLGLNCTIQKIQVKDQYSIYIIKSSIEKLREKVLPFFHKSMYYKLGLNSS